MSVRVMTHVWDATFPTTSAKLVALKLADCANDDGENIYPSAARVERDTGCSLSVVRECLADMEASGLLLVIDEAYGHRSGRSTTVRQFDMARLRALADGRLAWVQADVTVYDQKTRAPKTDPISGAAKMRKAWRLAPAPVAVATSADTPPPAGPLPLRQPEGTPPPAGGDPSASRTPTPPAAGPKPSLEPSLEPSLSPELPSRSETGVGVESTGSKKSADASVVRFAKRWDATGRAAVLSLVHDPAQAHVGRFLVGLVGGLNPPREADAAGWVTLAAPRLAPLSVEGLGRLAERIIAARKYDLPSVSDLSAWATAVASELSTERAAADRLARKASAERAAIARLAPDIEPDAAPQRRDALALRRAFVGSTHDGAALDAAWLMSLLVIDRNGPRLKLSVGERLHARWIESCNLAPQIIAAARQLWPHVAYLDCAVHETQPTGDAA